MDSQPSQSGRSFSIEINGSRSPVANSKSPSVFAKSISDASSQSLSSILNNPQVGKSGVYGSDASWVGWWSSSTTVPPPEFTPLGLTPKPGSEISRSEFQPYLSSVAHHLNRFEDIRNHSTQESLDLESNIEGGGAEGRAQGEALVACLREVPALYFKEDFELEDGATFRAACPFASVSENMELQEKLSHYLDTVELHLVNEISLRSNSFFEAQRQLQELNVKIVEGCKRVRELKETVRLVDGDLVDSARQIQELNITRNNLLALQQKLRLILYVNQALSALKLLIASADCAGALDVTDDMKHLMDGDELTGLHCFRHLRDHVVASIDSINSILSAEFMRASMHGVGDTDKEVLLKAKARATIPTNGTDDIKIEEEDAYQFRDRLLPLVIGLLRTAKLPAVLRMYRDVLTADMKTAIKTMVAELLPLLVARPLESDFTPGERLMDAEGSGSSLASKLRSLPPESFLQLLEAIFKIVMVHLMRAAEVKKAIEWIMCNLDGHYAADSVAAAIALGAAASETQEADGVGSSLSYSPQRSTSKIISIQSKGNDVANSPNISRNFRADVLRENTEALFAACDASHGRWAKLLGVRAVLHPRLRLQEFLGMYNLSQGFISSTEKIGGRLSYSIRGTLQSQAKAFVDFQHESRMAKLKAVLDQETWAEVDVPEEFCIIISSLAFMEPSINGNVDDVSDNTVTESSDMSFLAEDTAQNISAPSFRPVDSNSNNMISSSGLSNNQNVVERGRSSQTILFRGVGYHMVNCGLILLKMLSEYVDMNNFLPALSSEVVHRVVEVLKFFNTRTCQLVLGAGALQVSGLRSITAKHLALASQVISFIYAVIPDIRRVLFLKVPETRKALLLLELDRVAQDYKVHQDEIHTKLLQIMRERLLVHLRGLPQIVESWNKPEDTDTQPSQFARSLTKEVSYLQRLLSRTLHESDAQAIFRKVVMIFHTQISEAFSSLEISSPQAQNRMYRDIQHILGCIRLLPSDNLTKSDTPNWGQLDELLLQRFGAEKDVK